MIDIGLEFEVGETEDDLEFDAQDYVGLSAYQIAVKHGYKGTEEQWIASISKTKTSQLENDGDGKSPFATEAYVNEHSSTGGTTDYNQLTNKPKINGVELSGEVELAVPHSTSELNNDGDGTSLYATQSDVGKALGVIEQAMSEGYVPKVSTEGNERLYRIKTDGEQETIDLMESAAAYSVVKRGVDGTTKVGEPIEDSDATTKKYVDNGLAEKVEAKALEGKLDKYTETWSSYYPPYKAYITSNSGYQSTRFLSTSGGANGSYSNCIVIYDGQGNLRVDDTNWERASTNTGTLAVNQKYVKEQVVLAKDSLQYQIDNIMTFLRSTVFTETTVEDSYSTRTTAQGLSIIDGTATKLLKIEGKTEASTNYLDLSQNVIPTSGTLDVKITPAENTITFSGTPAEQVKFQVGRCYLFHGTYTLYIPQHDASNGIDWNIAQSSSATPLVELDNTKDIRAISFQVTFSGYYYLYATAKTTELSLTTQLAILADNKVQDLPSKFPIYYEGFHHAGFRDITSIDTTGEKTSNVVLHDKQETYELTMYDYIDFTTEIPTVYIWGVSQHYTDPKYVSSSGFASYIRDASGKYILGRYKTPQKTTKNLYLSNTYIAYRNGTETVDLGEHELAPIITQIYYEKVGE